MASRRTHTKNQATAQKTPTASTEAGVRKRRYRRVRYDKNGLLDVGRKTGKYFKIAQQNQRESHLLSLPPEIRNKIFKYALGGKTFEIKRQPPDNKVRNRTRSKHALALLAVCRQIYAETALL